MRKQHGKTFLQREEKINIDGTPREYVTNLSKEKKNREREYVTILMRNKCINCIRNFKQSELVGSL